MKIVHIIDKLNVGGAQKLLITFAREVQHRNVDLTVIGLWGDIHKPIVDELESLGARVEVFPASSSIDFKRLKRLIRFFGQNQFDIICTHLFQAGILGAILGRYYNTPVVSTLHNISLPDGKLRSLVWRKMINFGSSCVICVGSEVEKAHAHWLSDKPCEVLPNPVASMPPVSDARKREIRTELMGDPDGYLVMSVGVVSPQKAFADLVEAIGDVRKKEERVYLAIVGGGRKYNVAIVEQKIEELGLGDCVRLLGMRDDVPQLLAAADLFVSSAHWEGLPIAVLEAMSAGLPIVATAVGDVPRAVVEGTGLLVQPKQPTELGAAITQLLGDPELRARFGQAAKEHVKRHHDPSVWVDKQLELFSQFISTGK